MHLNQSLDVTCLTHSYDATCRDCFMWSRAPLMLQLVFLCASASLIFPRHAALAERARYTMSCLFQTKRACASVSVALTTVPAACHHRRDLDVASSKCILPCSGAKVSKNGMASVTYLISYDQQFTNPTMGDARVRAIPGVVTILPPIVTVFLAIVTRNVLVSLFCGVWMAAFFIHSCALASMPALHTAWLCKCAASPPRSASLTPARMCPQ